MIILKNGIKKNFKYKKSSLPLRFVREHFVVVQHLLPLIVKISVVQFFVVDELKNVVVFLIVVLVLTRKINKVISKKFVLFKHTSFFASSACFNNSSLNGAKFGIFISLDFFSNLFYQMKHSNKEGSSF